MNKDVWAKVLIVLGFPLLFVAVPFAIWNAYVGVHLWEWFAVPLGAPMINLWHFAGLIMLLGVFRSNHQPDEAKGFADIFKKLITRAVTLLIVLGLAWVVKGQM